MALVARPVTRAMEIQGIARASALPSSNGFFMSLRMGAYATAGGTPRGTLAGRGGDRAGGARLREPVERSGTCGSRGFRQTRVK
ncbi:hypothetical protein KNE206_31090 [Kitasatospora sp. NE20-6]